MVCRNMRSNTEAFEKMKEEKIINNKNFLEVHYDTWMENTMKETESIFKFLGMRLTPELVGNIQAHFSSSKPGYLFTYRGADWDRERWREELSDGQVRYVERKCGTSFGRKNRKKDVVGDMETSQQSRNTDETVGND